MPATDAHRQHGHHHHHHHGGHGHHHHGHDHGDGAIDHGRAFMLGILLNLAFVAVEGVAGFVGNSVALLADAGHNLSDVLGLAMAWGAWRLARRAPSPRFTYGLQGSSILAALANAVLLFVACGGIAWEAAWRFVSPSPAQGGTMMLVAGMGILVNAGTAILFARGSKGDINIRGAFLHMMADALVSAGVVVAGLLVALTGAAWIDPAASLLVVGVIMIGTWGLLRDAVGLALNAVPGSIDPVEVGARLGSLEGVEDVHHLHIWPISTTRAALTAHLVVSAPVPHGDLLARASALVADEFGIAHATLQVEPRDGCPDTEGARCA